MSWISPPRLPHRLYRPPGSGDNVSRKRSTQTNLDCSESDISPHQPVGPRDEGDLITVEGYSASLHPEGLRWTQPRHSIPSPSRRYRWAALMNNFRSGERTPHNRDVSHRATSLPPRLPILLLPAAVGSPIWLFRLCGSDLSDRIMACIASYANDTFMKKRCIGIGSSGSLRRH